MKRAKQMMTGGDRNLLGGVIHSDINRLRDWMAALRGARHPHVQQRTLRRLRSVRLALQPLAKISVTMYICFVALLAGLWLEPLVYAEETFPSGLRLALSPRIGVVNTPEDFDYLLRALGHPDLAQREEAERALREMGEIAIPALIQLGLWNPDHLLRQNAITALTQIGPRAREPLIKALKDKEARVRAGAAQALGILGDPKTIQPLIHTLGDRVPAVRQEAFTALAKMGSPAISHLINALLDLNSDVRRNAAVLLQRIGRPAVSPVIRILTHKNPKMRVAGARILGQIGDPSAIPHLVPMLRNADRAVREQAVTALVKFQRRAVKPLMTVLRGTDTSLHDGAFAVLAGIGKPVIPAFARFIRESRVAYNVRAKAGRFLRQWGWRPANITERVWGNIVMGEWEQIPNVSQALPPLMVTMEDPSKEIRKAASKAIVPFGERAVTALATEILRRKDPLFFQSAAEALGKINIRDFLAVEALIGLLQNRSLPVQWAVLKTLGKIGNYLAVAPLLGVVEDKNRPLAIRIQAVAALEKLGDPRVTPRLVAVLERVKQVPFQKALIDTLGQLHSAEAAPSLIKYLGHENPALGKRASEAIIKLRPLPIALLINTLTDRRPLVQKNVVALLSQIGEPAVEQLIVTLKKRETSPGIKAQAELFLIKVLEALPGNVDVLIKALDAPSDRVRLLAVESLSKIKTIKAVPSLLDIAEQEWRYPAHLREKAKAAIHNIQGSVEPEKWKAILAQRRLAQFRPLASFRQVGVRMLYALLGYWLMMSLIGIGLSRLPARARRPSYGQHLLAQVIRKKDQPVSRAFVQRGFRAGFKSVWGGFMPWLILTGGAVAALIWGRIIHSIAWTFYVWGLFFALWLWLQSDRGVEQISRLLGHRRRAARLLLAPMTYMGRLLFPMTERSAADDKTDVVEPPVSSDSEALSHPSDAPLTSFAMLLEGFSRSERIDILQALGEHAAGFPPTDPQEVLDVVFKEAYESIHRHGCSDRKEDVRAFLTTLVPMAMALSERVETIPETLSQMMALVGSSNSLVKLELFFADVLDAVEHAVLKGAFPIILELLQTGFFPTTELIEEAKSSADRPLLYYSWREIVSTKIHQDQFNLSDATHIALHYTSFRQRANRSSLLSLLGYLPHYADYQKIVDQWKKGSQKNMERIKRLREIAEQFDQFIAHVDASDGVLVGPWLTRRLEETFGPNGHPANWLFMINKSGVWMAPSFLTIDPKIPERLSVKAAGEGDSERVLTLGNAPSSVDAFDALMSQ